MTNAFGGGNGKGSVPFGTPPGGPTVTTGESNNQYCYTVFRVEQLTLVSNPAANPNPLGTQTPQCNYDIRYTEKTSVVNATLLEGGCNSVNCKPSRASYFTGPTVTDSNGVPFVPPKTVCDLSKNSPLGDFSISVTVNTTIIGCSKEVGADPQWQSSAPQAGEVLREVANSFYCGNEPPDGFGHFREEQLKKILECLCKMEKEPDSDKAKEILEEMLKKMGECASKYNAHLMDGIGPHGGPNNSPAGRIIQQTWPLPWVIPHWPAGQTKGEWMADRLKQLYEACLLRTKFCKEDE